MARFDSLKDLGAHSTLGHHPAFRSDHLKIVFRDVVGIPLDMRHDFIPLNTGSYFPVGPKDLAFVKRPSRGPHAVPRSGKCFCVR